MPSKAGRRLRKIQADIECLADWLKGGSAVGYGSLPKDAKIVGCHYDPDRHGLHLVIESDTYGDVPEFSEIPWVDNDPTTHTVWKQGATDKTIDLIIDMIRDKEWLTWEPEKENAK